MSMDNQLGNTPEFSAPFEISRYDEKSHGANMDRVRSEIRFRLVDGKPKRLGDGSFGTVYLGYGQGKDVAIKLFYDNNAMRLRQLRELSAEELEAHIMSLAQEQKLDAEQLKKLIMDHQESDYALLEKLQKKYKKSGNEKKAPELHDFISFLDKLTQRASSSAVYRFQSERTVSGLLMDSNERKTESRKTPGLIEIWGGAEDFASTLSKPEFENIRRYFEEEKSIKISNHVLVMDRYQYSLKDLLESPLKELDIRNGKENDKRSGYEVLREHSLDLRVREALLMLQNVSFGLYQLHNVDKYEPLFHLDIKPGNIFIERTPDDRFQVALGDLGNLPLLPDTAPQSTEYLGSMAEPIGHDFAPGTQHYRSPEQKYYMDVANVQVVHCELSDVPKLISENNEDDAITEPFNNDDDSDQSQQPEPEPNDHHVSTSAPSDSPGKHAPAKHRSGKDASQDTANKRVVLHVKDPKFKNTLIEKGDAVIFSKDTERKRRTIAEDPYGNERTGHFAFVLSDGVGEDSLLSEDDRTQVEFYKKQSYRTDLFGIGAVAFDIITAGWSPEKFYESLRKFETISIQQIIDRYDTLRRGEIEGENPDLSQIFAPFRNENDPSQRYPDNDIIEFILKCMLYQSKGTFYQENNQKPWRASKVLKDKIEELRNTYIRDYPDLPAERSLLIHRPEIKDTGYGQSIQFDREIAKLQGLVPWPKVEKEEPAMVGANRLLYGAYYFSQIVELIRTKISSTYVPGEFQQTRYEESAQSATYLRQILPTYISLKWEDRKAKLDFDQAPSWLLHTTLLKELRDNRLEQLIRSTTNPFVPNRVAGMRREIRLFAPQAQGLEPSEGNRQVKCEYRFRDASQFRLTPSPGDWIVCQGQLWKVIDLANNSELTIRLETIDDMTDYDEGLAWNLNESENYVDGTYFSALDPFKYYLDMLGVYLQHLIFAYSPLTTTTRDRVDISALLDALEIGPDIFIKPPVPESAKTGGAELTDIHTKYVHLYLMLTLHESEDSYYNKKGELSDVSNESGRFVLNSVKKYAEYQYKQILIMLKITGVDSSDYPQPITSLEHLPEFKQMADDLVKDPFDIERAIKRSGIVSWK